MGGLIIKNKSIKTYLEKHPYLAYTVLFVLILMVGLLPIEIKNQSFLFSGLFATKEGHFDALKQHLIFMEDYVSVIKGYLFNGQPIDIYRSDLGLGGDFILNYTYYSLFDPMTLIAYIIPITHIELSYYIILMLRIYLSGLFMMLLISQMISKEPSTRVIGGLLYAFSTLTLYSSFRHPMFTNGVMYLPLLIYGAEKIFEKKTPLLFILVVFLAVISQFYIFIFTLFGFAVYLITKTIESPSQTKWLLFIKIVSYGFIGVMMGAFVLLPQAFALLEGSRTSSKGFILFDGLDLSSIIVSHLIPIMGNKYSIGVGNMVILFGLFAYTFKKDTPYRWIKYSLVIFFVLNVMSIFAFAINGFSYVNNRWTFVMLVPTILAISLWIDKKVVYTLIEINQAIKALMILIITAIFTTASHFVINYFQTVIYVILLVIPLFTMYVMIAYVILKKVRISEKHINRYNNKFLKKTLLISLVISTLIISFYYTGSLTPNNALDTYYSNRDRYETWIDDSSFYRVEQKIFAGNVDSFSNDNLLYNYHATYQYNTMASGYINQFLHHLEVTNANNSVGYNGFSFRTKLLALSQVNYVIIRESEKTLPPYGFEQIGYVMVEKYDEDKIIQSPGGNLSFEGDSQVYEKALIYENQNDVKFGYMAYQTVSDTQYLSMDPLDQENVLLTHVVLSEDELEEISDLSPEVLYHEPPIEKVDQNTLRLIIPAIQNEEVYVKLEGFQFSQNLTTFTKTYYETKDVKMKEINYKIGTHMYVENKTHLVNLGYYENEEDLEVFRHFDNLNFTYESISYAQVSMDELAQKTDNFNENTLDQLTFNSRGFTGNIQTNQKGYLVVNLPYTKNFRAYVNQQEVSIKQANIGYMAIELEQGTNNISFVYHTRGLQEGLYISFAFFIVSVICVIYFEIKKKDKNNEIHVDEVV